MTHFYCLCQEEFKKVPSDEDPSKLELKATYDSIINYLSRINTEKAIFYQTYFARSQSGWEKYASNHCLLEAKSENGPEGTNGLFAECYARKTVLRISELNQQFDSVKSALNLAPEIVRPSTKLKKKSNGK